MLSSINRLRARAFKALAILVACAVANALPARAATTPATATASFWYAGTRLVFEHPQLRAGALAVGNDDLGLGRFLTKLDATLDYRPGQNTVTVVSGDRNIVTFTLGDPRYVVDGVSQSAPFAPYLSNGLVYLPFLDLARALHVDPIDDGTTTVLQPKLASLDVRNENRVTLVTIHGASTLRFKRLSEASDSNVSLAFLGTGSTLDRDRTIAGPGLKGVTLEAGGTPKNPTTVVNFSAPPGSTHALVPSDSVTALTIAFAPPGIALGGTVLPSEGNSSLAMTPLVVREARGQTATSSPPAVASATGAPTPTAASLPVADITAFTTDDRPDGLRIHLAITGDVTYEWHRLPDNRWYVDFKPATLSIPTQEVPLQNSSVQSLRMKAFVGPNDRLATVRLALSLATPRVVAIVPEPGGLDIAVDSSDDTSAVRVGYGEIAGGKIVAAIVPAPTPAPDPAGSSAPWKFSPSPGATGNGKLIVIDPGHGGSDAGAARNGLVEKDLNLELSKKLRAALVARGWQVKMTRDTDVDVFEPNDSAHDELQARDDIANGAGARMLISMHTNSFTS